MVLVLLVAFMVVVGVVVAGALQQATAETGVMVQSSLLTRSLLLQRETSFYLWNKP